MKLKVVEDYDFLIYGWELSDNNISDDQKQYQKYNLTFNRVLNIIQGLEFEGIETRKKIIVLSDKDYTVVGTENMQSINQQTSALLNVQTQENQNISAASLDLLTTGVSGSKKPNPSLGNEFNISSVNFFP